MGKVPAQSSGVQRRATAAEQKEALREYNSDAGFPAASRAAGVASSRTVVGYASRVGNQR